MSPDNSGRNSRAVALRRNGFALTGRNSGSEREDLSDYALRGRVGYTTRPWTGRQGNSGVRNGDMYGWGREGRVRLEPRVFLRDPGGPLGGYCGRQQGVPNFNRETFRDLHNCGSEQDQEPIRTELVTLPYCLVAHHPVCQPYRPDIFIPNRLCIPDQYIQGALEFPDIGEESQANSLDSSVSEYSLRHMDRMSRPYHYQPPYVEDYVSELEEELLRQQDELDSLHDIMAPSEFSGLLSPRGGYLVDPGDGREIP